MTDVAPTAMPSPTFPAVGVTFWLWIDSWVPAPLVTSPPVNVKHARSAASVFRREARILTIVRQERS
jgi:hypothetical protein